MVRISTGDLSGRPDTAGVNRDQALYYAERMFVAVLYVNFYECRQIHTDLNRHEALYQLALDLFKCMCRQRGFSRAGKWREYCE